MHEVEEGWTELVADLANKHEKMENVAGSIQLEFNDDGDFDVSFHVHDLPGYCDTCYIALVNKDSCDGELLVDDHHFDGSQRKRMLDHRSEEVEEEEAMTDPFDKDTGTTKVVSDVYGDAVGGILKLNNGYDKHQNHCKVAVVWAEVEEEVVVSKRSKPSKSAKSEKGIRRRTHETRMEKVMR